MDPVVALQIALKLFKSGTKLKIKYLRLVTPLVIMSLKNKGAPRVSKSKIVQD